MKRLIFLCTIMTFTLVLFLPDNIVKADQNEVIEILECDLVNPEVNYEITQAVNLITRYEEVAISGGELLGYNDNYAFNDGSGGLEETEWYCSNNYVLYSIEANFTENSTEKSYDSYEIGENQIEGWEVDGLCLDKNKGFYLLYI